MVSGEKSLGVRVRQGWWNFRITFFHNLAEVAVLLGGTTDWETSHPLVGTQHTLSRLVK